MPGFFNYYIIIIIIIIKVSGFSCQSIRKNENHLKMSHHWYKMGVKVVLLISMTLVPAQIIIIIWIKYARLKINK
jgi:hypothetical protein